MTLGTIGAPAIFAVVSAALTALLVLLAERVGWTDDGREAPERKLQARAVPLVGGAALFLVLLGLTGVGLDLARGLAAQVDVHPGAFAAALALGCAFVLGLVDDLAPRGLGPGLKLYGQLAIAAVCARHVHDAHVDSTPAEWSLAFAVALLAMNAFNTFDNADGAASALAALGLSFVVLPITAALLGFLPFNLWLRRGSSTTASTPLAYLGDSGSHLLGVIVALAPATWPVLTVPLLDLGRLSIVRWQRGSRPWIGDRRHLAHRLQARGLGPTAVVLALLAIAAPGVFGGVLAATTAWALPAGLVLTLAAFVFALRWTPDIP